MNIYLLTRPSTRLPGYGCFNAAVVLAETEEEARKIHPYGIPNDENPWEWIPSADVVVEYLGKSEVIRPEGIRVLITDNIGG